MTRGPVLSQPGVLSRAVQPPEKTKLSPGEIHRVCHSCLPIPNSSSGAELNGPLPRVWHRATQEGHGKADPCSWESCSCVCQQVLWSSEQSVTLVNCLRGGAHDPKKLSKLSWVGGRSLGFRANLKYFISGPGFASCDLCNLFSLASVISPAMVALP